MARNRRAPKPEGLVVSCPTCNTSHSDLTENYWQQRKYHCRACRADIAKKDYEKNSVRIAEQRKKSGVARKATLKNKYGITVETWKQLVNEQNGACLICSFRPENPTSLHIDHNHLTGEVRGLLCNNCNVGLGYFSDNPDRLIKASMYLQLCSSLNNPTNEKELLING
jgi:Recombination endonuclease VII